MYFVDPFFGVTWFERNLAKWLNRILIIIELYVIVMEAFRHVSGYIFDAWVLIFYFPLCLLGVSILHRVIRAVWALILSIIHGTADGDEYMSMQREGRARRDLRRMERQVRRNKKNGVTPAARPTPVQNVMTAEEVAARRKLTEEVVAWLDEEDEKKRQEALKR